MFAYNQVGGGAKKSRRSPAQLAWRQAVGGSLKKRSSSKRSRSSSPISRGSTVTLDRARQILREYYAKHGSLQGLRSRMVVTGGAKHSPKRSTKRKSPRKSHTKKSSPKRKSTKRKSKTRKSKTRKSSTRKSSPKKRKSPVKRRSPKPWYRL